MRQHARHRVVERFAEPLALRDGVDEGNRLMPQMLVHGA